MILIESGGVWEMLLLYFFTEIFEVHQEGGQVFWTDLRDYVGIWKELYFLFICTWQD